MPDRVVRQVILASDKVNELSWAGEVFYRRLMSIADDFGRYEAVPSLLRAYCYPKKLDRVSEPDIVKWMSECSEAGLIRMYTIKGKDYLQIEEFGQRLRAMKSKFPPPPGNTGGQSPSPADICQPPPAPVDSGLLKRNESETESETETEGEEEPPPPPPVDLINLSQCYDIEADLLKNQTIFEGICMAAGRDIETAKLSLKKFHLHQQENEKYPKSRAALTAGFQKWLLNENSNGKQKTGNSTTKQVASTGHTGL